MSEYKVIIGSSKTFDHIIIQKRKLNKYKLWVDKDIIKEGIKFYSALWGYG
jgi:hypothetical protein